MKELQYVMVFLIVIASVLFGVLAVMVAKRKDDEKIDTYLKRRGWRARACTT